MKTIISCSADAQLGPDILRALQSVKCRLIDCKSTSEVITQLRREDVALLISVVEDIDATNRLLEALEQESYHGDVLFLVRDNAVVEDAIRAGRPINFLAAEEAQGVDAIALNVTTRQILRDVPVSIHNYISGDTVLTKRITKSSQIIEAVQNVEAFAKDANCNSQVCTNLETVADELLTNAVYNAPCRDGEFLYPKESRTEEVTLPDHEAAVLTAISDGRRLGLSVADPFGNLTAGTVAAQLARAHVKGNNQVNLDDKGGARLDLVYS